MRLHSPASRRRWLLIFPLLENTLSQCNKFTVWGVGSSLFSPTYLYANPAVFISNSSLIAIPGVWYSWQIGGGKLWVSLQSSSQGFQADPCHQAGDSFFTMLMDKHALNDNTLGAGGHRSAGHNKRDQYHATVRFPLCGQILWLLLQKHWSLDCHGILRCWQCFWYNEGCQFNLIFFVFLVKT